MVAVVGAVGVEVLPNVRNFNREMRAKLIPEADKLGQDLGASMGRNMRERLSAELKNLPNAKVGLNDSEATRQISDLRAQLEKLSRNKTTPTVKPNVDSREIDRLTMRLDELRRKTATANVDVNDKGAVAKLTGMKAALSDLEHKVANPKIDVNGIAHADASLAALDAQLDAFGRKRETAHVNVDSSPASRSIGGLMSALLALAPAAVPVGAAITGAIGATLPVLTAAGAGFGAFGIAVAGSVKLIEADMKSMQKSTQKVATAQAAVDSAKGPAARAAAQKRLNVAQAQYNNLLKAMSPAERTIIKDWGKLVTTFDKWDRTIGLPALAKVAHGLFPLLNAGFKIMTPLVRGTADALVTLEKGANRALNGAFGKRFIKFLETSAPKAILGLGHAFANIGRGIGGIILAFAPFQKSVLGGLDSITKKFADWGTNLGSSSGFHKFIQYVKDNGPQLGKLLRAAGSAVVALVKAAAGFGAGELKTMTSLLNGLVSFANKNPRVAQMAVAVLALAKAVQVLKLASIGGGIAKLFKVLAGGAIGKAAASSIGGDAAAVGAGGAAAKSGGLAARAITLAGGGEVGVATLAGALGLVVVPLILSYLNKNFVPQGSHVLDNRGTHRVNTPTGPVDVPVLPHPARGGGGVGGRQRAKDQAAAGFSAPPLLTGAQAHATVVITGPPILSPNAGLKHKGKGYALEGPASISAQIDNSFKTQGKKALKDFNASFYGNQGTSGTGKKSNLPNQGTPGIGQKVADTKIHVTVLGAATATQIFKALRAKVVNVPDKKQIRVAESGAKTAAGAIGQVANLLHGTPSKKQIRVAESGAKTAAGAIGQVAGLLGRTPSKKQIRVAEQGAKTAAGAIGAVAHILSGTPNKKNTKVSTTGAGAAKTAIGAIRTVLGLTPNHKDIHHTTPGAGAAKTAINAIRTVLGLTPNKKVINHSTPGAAAAHTAINAIKTVLGQTPNKKVIQHSTPGSLAAHSAIAAIKLVLAQTPNRKDIHASTPGAVAAHAAIQGIKDVLNGIPNTKTVALKVAGSVSNVIGKLFASGGHVQGPGGPRDDAIVARLSNNEFVQPAHVVQAEGVAKMEALRKGRATIVPKYADGGLIVNVSDPGVPGMKSGIGSFINNAANKINSADVASYKKQLASLGGSGGGGGNWLPTIAKALALLHQPIGLAGLFERVIQGESGGNPRAINLYDSNAKAGHPSVGLAQVIRGTFEAFAGPFRNLGPFLAGVSINPLANIYAGLNYGIQTYGSVAQIPGIASELHGGGYRPYATGGPVPGTGNHDSVPAMLTPGEFVLNKGAVSKVGMGILHAINGGGGTGNGFFHAGGPVLGIRYGAIGDWVEALAIQARQLKGAFHQHKWDSRVSTDVAGHSPHALPNLAKYDPKVKQLVAYLWGRHGKGTTFDDALAHFSHGDHPMAFLDIMRAYNAGKGFLTEWKGKGKGRHRFIPDSTLQPFQHGLRRYEGMYHHDVQALEHKLHYKPENGQWTSGLDGAVAHVVAHALHRNHSQFAARPWNPLNAGEKTLQQVLKSNAQTAEFNKDLNKFISWGLFDLVENLSSSSSGDSTSMLPTARAAAKNRGLANKLNAAYKVADRTTGINPLVNLGYSAVKYDRGGYIQPGHVAVNLSGHPEAVLDPKQTRNLERLASRASGASVNIEKVEVHDGSDVVAFGRRLAFTLANAGL